MAVNRVSNEVILEKLENLIKSHESLMKSHKEDKEYTHDTLEAMKKDLDKNNDMTRYHDKILIAGNGVKPITKRVDDIENKFRIGIIILIALHSYDKLLPFLIKLIGG
jgi:hypothetical protein